VDVPLNGAGRAEAALGGELLAAAGILPDMLDTSVLRRSITTAAWPSTHSTAIGFP